jgi:hypothetical protein
VAISVHIVGWVTSNGHEAKSKIKHPSDTPKFELGWLIYMINCSIIYTIYPDRLTDWLIGLLTAWMSACLNDWLKNWGTDWFTDPLSDFLTHSLIHSCFHSLTHLQSWVHSLTCLQLPYHNRLNHFRPVCLTLSYKAAGRVYLGCNLRDYNQDILTLAAAFFGKKAIIFTFCISFL